MFDPRLVFGSSTKSMSITSLLQQSSERTSVPHSTCCLEQGIVPYVLLALIRFVGSSSALPNTSSRCSPSPSASRNVKMRTGSWKMWSSVIPAHVLRKAAVGFEFIASAVTSAIESQQVELMPMEARNCQPANVSTACRKAMKIT